MIYLTAEQVLFIHARLVAETGGAHGIRDLSLIQSAVARPLATLDAKELYPDLLDKAAALLDSLVNNHPFVDGNKRTGITATGLFLMLNGKKLTASHMELLHFTLEVATSHPDIPTIANWLKTYSESIEKP
jgi:death-on-curing protein